MERSKGDRDEGPPQFINFGKPSSSGRNENSIITAAKLKERSVTLSQQLPAEKVSTREKMELPQSYHTQGGRSEGGAMKKDSTNHFISNDVKISSQMRELSLAEPHTIDIENIVKPNRNVRGHGTVSSDDQGSLRAGQFAGGADESRPRMQPREFGSKMQRFPIEDNGREIRGRGREIRGRGREIRGRGREIRGRGRRGKNTDEDDYHSQKRKETYLISDYIEKRNISGHGGRSDEREENVLNDYIYDVETDQYYPKEIYSDGGIVGVTYCSDDHTFVDKGSSSDAHQDTNANKYVKYSERKCNSKKFIDDSEGRGGPHFHGNQIRGNYQRLRRGRGDGSYRGRGSKGRVERSVGVGRDGGWMKQEDQSSGWDHDARGRGEGMRGKREMIQSPYSERFNTHSHEKMTKHESYREKRGESEVQRQYGARTKQKKGNYTRVKDVYSSNWDQGSLTRSVDKQPSEPREWDQLPSKEKEKVEYEKQEKRSVEKLDHVSAQSNPNLMLSGSSNWDHLQAIGVPASAKKINNMNHTE